MLEGFEEGNKTNGESVSLRCTKQASERPTIGLRGSRADFSSAWMCFGPKGCMSMHGRFPSYSAPRCGWVESHNPVGMLKISRIYDHNLPGGCSNIHLMTSCSATRESDQDPAI